MYALVTILCFVFCIVNLYDGIRNKSKSSFVLAGLLFFCFVLRVFSMIYLGKSPY